MKKGSEATLEEKLVLIQATLRGHIGSVERLAPKFPQSLLQPLRDIAEGNWDGFVFFDTPEEKALADEASKELKKLVSKLEGSVG